MKDKIMKMPMPVYNFLSNRAKTKQTTMKHEAKSMMEEYLELKKLETYLQKKKGGIFIIK